MERLRPYFGTMEELQQEQGLFLEFMRVKICKINDLIGAIKNIYKSNGYICFEESAKKIRGTITNHVLKFKKDENKRMVVLIYRAGGILIGVHDMDGIIVEAQPVSPI